MQSSLTRGHFKAGWDSVRNAKLRSFWTMLGIIIGVTSVITVLGIGQGVERQVTGQIHRLGSDLIVVRPAEIHPGSGSGNAATGLISGTALGAPIRQKDISTVSDVKGVGASSPVTIVTGKVTGDTGTYNDGFVIGATGDLPNLLNQSVAYGGFFEPDDNGGNAAVLGQHAADTMFNADVPLGHTFQFHGQTFVVRGIFNSFNTSPIGEGADFNNAIFIPNDTAEQLTNGAAPIYEILAKPSNPKQTPQVASAVRRALDQSHGGQSNLAVLQGSQNLATSQDIVSLLTKLVGGVAAISLLVGGIGIMNVMLVSVAERTHEIGIRKAIGATNSQILSQFMIEATLLSLGGGIIGVILACLIDVALRLTTNLQPVITWQTIVLGAGVSLIAGIVFGTIPAVKAARRDPIEALRSE